MARSFLSASARVGSNPFYVQGAGGNTSLKFGEILWVKASGARLADALVADIFVDVTLEAVRNGIREGAPDPVAGAWDARCVLRPSIETSLHALFPHPVVFHVHCVNTLAWAVQTGVDKALAQRCEGLAWVRVPYRRPGPDLTEAVASALAVQPADVVILDNHGLIVGGADCDTVERLLGDVARRLAVQPRRVDGEDLPRLKQVSDGTSYRPTCHEDAHSLALTAEAARVAASGSLYPDHVVFLGSGVAVAADRAALSEVIAASEGLRQRPVVLVPGAGVLVPKELNEAREDMVRALAMVVARIPDGATVAYLTSAEEQAIVNWDAEKYRLALQDC
jgi:rhamnose utilization protein RhaD (predicted bifunctional aldolase and dehydrogenase)